MYIFFKIGIFYLLFFNYIEVEAKKQSEVDAYHIEDANGILVHEDTV